MTSNLKSNLILGSPVKVKAQLNLSCAKSIKGGFTFGISKDRAEISVLDTKSMKPCTEIERKAPIKITVKNPPKIDLWKYFLFKQNWIG